jgi:hypothetical protein
MGMTMMNPDALRRLRFDEFIREMSHVRFHVLSRAMRPMREMWAASPSGDGA